MQTGCVKDKRNVYAAGCFRCNESSFGCDFLAVDEQFFAVRLVHENAGYFILFTGNKASVRYRIGQRNFIERIDFFFSLNGGLRADFNRHIVEAYRSNFAFAEFYGLRVRQLIAVGFLCIEFFHAVLILGRAVFVRVNRERFSENFACGIGRILGAVTILETCYAELDALDYAILRSLYDFELCVFLDVDKIIAINLAILGDYNIKIGYKLTAVAALCLMHDVCAIR